MLGILARDFGGGKLGRFEDCRNGLFGADGFGARMSRFPASCETSYRRGRIMCQPDARGLEN